MKHQECKEYDCAAVATHLQVVQHPDVLKWRLRSDQRDLTVCERLSGGFGMAHTGGFWFARQARIHGGGQSQPRAAYYLEEGGHGHSAQASPTPVAITYKPEFHRAVAASFYSPSMFVPSNFRGFSDIQGVQML